MIKMWTGEMQPIQMYYPGTGVEVLMKTSESSVEIICYAADIRRGYSSRSLTIGGMVKVKIKVKLSLCFNRSPRHEGVLGGVEV
jgi:hypothetical protein